nr:reverse transcriptase domain-containing protein [Tanacetum cinerariifolium]
MHLWNVSEALHKPKGRRRYNGHATLLGHTMYGTHPRAVRDRGDILYLEKLLNDDPSQLPLMELKQAEETKAESSLEEPPELELKELPSHLEYAFLEETDKLPIIIATDLNEVEKEALIKVLKSHKRAIAWKTFDIKGIDPRFCTHKILMEEDY